LHIFFQASIVRTGFYLFFLGLMKFQSHIPVSNGGNYFLHNTRMVCLGELQWIWVSLAPFFHGD